MRHEIISLSELHSSIIAEQRLYRPCTTGHVSLIKLYSFKITVEYSVSHVGYPQQLCSEMNDTDVVWNIAALQDADIRSVHLCKYKRREAQGYPGSG